MANYTALVESVKQYIKANGMQAITGDILQGVLMSVIDTFGTGSVYRGVATPNTDPQNPDANVFYFAWEQGVYAKFGNLTLPSGGMYVLDNKSGQWTMTEIIFPALTEMQEKVENALSTAQQAVSIAETANSNADVAIEGAQAADAKAQQAVGTADEAKDIATEARDLASAAEADAGDAQNLAAEAVAAAGTAQGVANQAIDAANTAKVQADSALQIAGQARDEASAAGDKANTAVSTAETAATNAEAALNQSETASQIAQQAATDSAEAKADSEEALTLAQGAIPNSEKGVAGGVATLDENGLVPREQSGHWDLEDSYTSDRTDAAPTAHALHEVYEMHETDVDELNIRLDAVLELVKSVAGIGVAPVTVSVTGPGESKIVSIVTNGNWTLSVDQSWVTPSKTSGIGNDTVTLTVAANGTTSERNATLTVTNALGQEATSNIIQAARVETTEYTFSVAPANLTFAAAGESKTVVVVSKKQLYINGSASGAPVTVNYTSKLEGAGFSVTSTGVVASNNTTTNVRTGSLTLTQSESGKKATVTLNQGAGTQTIEYTNWATQSVDLTATPTSISASGGSSALATKATQTRTKTTKWNGIVTGTTPETQTVTVAATYTKVSGSGTLTSSTVTFGNNTSTSQLSGVYRATFDGKTDDVTITQAAGVQSIEYTDWATTAIDVSASPATVAAAGGTSQMSTKATQNRTKTTKWNGVVTNTQQETQTVTVTASYAKVSGDGSLSGAAVSFPNNTTNAAKSGVYRATYGGKTDDVTIAQAAGTQTIERGAWITQSVQITASSTNVAAAGGSSSLSTKASQARTVNIKWNGIVTDTQQETQTISVTPTYSKQSGGGTLSGSTVSFGNNTTANIVTGVYRATYDGKTSDVTISQAAGVQSKTLELSTYTKSFPATGGSTTIFGTYRELWNGVVTATTSGVSPTLSGSQTGFTISGNAVTAANRGTTAGAARTLSGNATYNGASAAYSITQEENKETYSALTLDMLAVSNPISGSDPTTKANGGTVTLGATASYTYSTGQTKSVDVKDSAAYNIASTSAGGVSISGRVLTWANRAAVEGGARSVTVRLSYNGASQERTFYQQANTFTFGSSISLEYFNYTPSSVSANGGTATPNVAYRQSGSYTSGQTGYKVQTIDDLVSGPVFSRSGGSSAASINSSTGVITWSANTTTSDRMVQVVMRGTAQGGYAVNLVATSSQSAYVRPTISLTFNYNQSGGTFVINASQAVKDQLDIQFTYTDGMGAGGDGEITMGAGSTSVQGYAGGPSYPIAGIIEVNHTSGGRLETSKAIYTWTQV